MKTKAMARSAGIFPAMAAPLVRCKGLAPQAGKLADGRYPDSYAWLADELADSATPAGALIARRDPAEAGGSS